MLDIQILHDLPIGLAGNEQIGTSISPVASLRCHDDNLKERQAIASTTMMEALMKRMARREISAGRHAFSMHLLGRVLNAAATAIVALKTRQRTVSRRRAIADLTPEQLKDIRHAEVLAPVLEVKAGLVTNLMSMR